MAGKKKLMKRETSFEEVMNSIKNKYGQESVMTLDQAAMDVESIPTGSFSLDIALGVGGLPKGRIIEIYGPEASGKTSLALHVVAEAQKKGEICAYIDAENALDPAYATKIGIDISKLIISQPDNGEQALDMVESMAASGQFSVIVIDSVPSLVPKSEIEGDIGDANVGRHAKLMSQALRKLVPVVNKSKCVVIFINQIRMNIGVLPGMNPEFTPGGKALKFYSSVRIDIRRIAQIKKVDEVVGGRTRIKVVKNKVAPPFRQTEVDIMYGEGISKEGEILAIGEKYGVLEKTGNSYKFGETTIGRGYESARTYLRENPDIYTILRSRIETEISREQQTEKPIELEESNTVVAE